MENNTEDITGVIVFDKGGRLLIVNGVVGKWSFPKGRRQVGETFLEAAVREAREESGIELTGETHSFTLKLRHATYFVYKMKKNFSEIPLKNLASSEEILEVKWCKRKHLLKESLNADLHYYARANYKTRV